MIFSASDATNPARSDRIGLTGNTWPAHSEQLRDSAVQQHRLRRHCHHGLLLARGRRVQHHHGTALTEDAEVDAVIVHGDVLVEDS